MQTPEVVFRFDGGGGVAEAWLEGEPHAHMLVEELMILANEHVGAFLAGRRREALYRVHERPDPQSVEHLLAKLADLGVPTPPAPDRLTPQQAAKLAGEISRAIAEYVEQSGRGREAFPALVLRALKQARYDPRNLGHSGLASTAYCHFTSPIRRYPDLSCTARCCASSAWATTRVPDDLAVARRAHLGARARGGEARVPRRRHLPRVAARHAVLFERGWEEPWEGEIIGLIGSGLFVRFGDVFEGFLPARRLPGEFFELNDARHRARRAA